jgi:Icc-related predicted phosphoesterase
VIRLAAAGDIHAGMDSVGLLGPQLSHLAERADVLLIAGDLTRHGKVEEAAVLAAELSEVTAAGLPVVAVLGNHDFHSDTPDEVAGVLRDEGVHVLQGEAVELELAGCRLGVAGGKGFGGGFAGTSGSEFGEPEMKLFMRRAKEEASALESALGWLRAECRVALTHYSPVPDTLTGERPEIFPFLGSSYLADAIDRHRPDLALHGHAHNGTEHGCTPGGVPVRNVAQPVIKEAYRVYHLALKVTAVSLEEEGEGSQRAQLGNARGR